ncbi:MAG: hypothetical protein GHCLOJNM_01014 [bacterium]|nr:hypothetical protein [bacterium]
MRNDRVSRGTGILLVGGWEKDRQDGCPPSLGALLLLLFTLPAFADITGSRSLPGSYVGATTAHVEIALTITGATPVYGAVVEETIPSGWNLASSSPTQDKFSSSTNKIAWLITDASGLDSQTLEYDVLVPLGQTGSSVFSGQIHYLLEDVETSVTMGGNTSLPQSTPTTTPTQTITGTPTQTGTPTNTATVTPTLNPLALSGSRDLPLDYSPGLPVEVSVFLDTDASVPLKGVILEETLPAGWSVTASTPAVDAFDSDSGKARWLLVDMTTVADQTVDYRLLPPITDTGNKTFSGSQSIRLSNTGYIITMGGETNLPKALPTSTPTVTPTFTRTLTHTQTATPTRTPTLDPNALIGTRNLPANYLPGEPLEVQVTLNLNEASPAKGLILQETVPSGWLVLDSTPGVDAFNSSSSQARWLLMDISGLPDSVVEYRVLSPITASGQQAFSGTLHVRAANSDYSLAVGGESLLPQGPPSLTPTRTITNTPTISPTRTRTPTRSPTIAPARVVGIRELPLQYAPGQTVSGRIRLEIGPESPPKGLIVSDQLPSGWLLLSSNPTANAFNSTSGEARWLLASIAGLGDGFVDFEALVPITESGAKSFQGTLSARLESSEYVIPVIGHNQVGQTPRATDTPSRTSTSTRTPTDSATFTPTTTSIPTHSFTPTGTSSFTPIPIDTDTPSATPTGTATLTKTPTPTHSGTQTPTATSSPTITETATGTDTQTPTQTVTHTVTESHTPSSTITETPTNTQIGAPTSTPTPTTTDTLPPTASASPTASGTDTPPLNTATVTRTGTATPSRSFTLTRTPTGSMTPSPTITQTPTATQFGAPSSTPTETATISGTATITVTPTDSRTPTPSATRTLTPSPSTSATATPSATVVGIPLLVDVIPDESITIGVGDAIFSFTFSHPMDRDRDPSVTFGTPPLYNIGLRFTPAPGWVDDFTWYGGVQLQSFVSDGLYTLRVTDARTATGASILPDTNHNFRFLKQNPNDLTEGRVTDEAVNALGMEWDRSGNADVSGHIIGSAPQANGPYDVVAGVGPSADAFVHLGLTSDTAYFYRIYEVSLNKGNGNGVRQLTNTFDGRTLARLANGRAEAISQTRMRITWESDDDPSTLGFLVRRATHRDALGDCGENPGTIIGEVPASTNEAIDMGLHADSVYYYDLCLLDDQGNSMRLENTFAGRTMSLDPNGDGMVNVRDLLWILNSARDDENSLEVLIEFSLGWDGQIQ